MLANFKQTTRRLKARYRAFARHPLAKENAWAALWRYVHFHAKHRIWPDAAVYPFVNDLRFLTRPGMGYIAHNIYVGMHDFAEMGFLLHFLRPTDHFIDVGANAGVYTLLAAGGCGAQVMAVEPVAATCDLLRQNLRLNNLEAKVNVLNIAAGASETELDIEITASDAWNHIILQPELATDVLRVPVKPLDLLTSNTIPTMLKIDVEGFEQEVLNGAEQTIQNSALKAIVIELNGSGLRYGFHDDVVHDCLIDFGFQPYQYDPFLRALSILPTFDRSHPNTLYLRDFPMVAERVSTAPPFSILGKAI